MNRNQAQRLLLGLIIIACFFVGNSLGYFLDQAATVSIDPDLWLRLQQCGNCFDAMVPLAGALARANQWTIIGSVGGLIIGLIVAYVLRWYFRPRKTGPLRRLSGFRQASELARFSQALTDTTDPQRILTQLHNEVTHVTGADCGSSFLLDPTSPEHRVALRVGEGLELQRLNAAESEAVTSGRSRLVQDFEAEGEAPPHVGIRSVMLVPITHEENAIGLIQLHSQQPATFDSELLDYVQVLAAQAAVAIHNAQRFEEQSRRSEALRQRVNQLQQLALIPNTVRVDRPLAANLESIAQTMQDTAGFGFVLISVYQPAGNHLALATATGLNAAVVERLQHQPVPWERLQPFLREEFRSNRVFLVPHAQTGDVYAALDLDRPSAPRGEHLAGQWHPDDLMLVPLYGSRGEIEGLITLSAPRDPQTPQNLVLEMLEVFASQTTLAIENSQALTQAEERLSESQGRAVQLGALTEVSGAIVGTLRAAEVIPLALDQLRRLIPYDSASFWKRDLTDNRWQLSGARSSQEDPERVAQRAERSQPALFTEISATRGVLFVPDVTRDPRFSFKEASSMRSWMGIPVLSQGEVSGVLVLEKAEDNFYGPAQAPLALAFANRLAVALDNARLYEESVGHAQELEEEATRRAVEGERRGQRLNLLNRIATELSDARDQTAVLSAALRVLREALSADYAAGVLFETEVPHPVPYVVAQAWLPAAEGSALPLTDNPLLERLAGAEAPLLIEAERAPLDAALLRPESLAWVGFNVGTALFLPLEADGRLAGLIGLGQAPGRRFWPADLDLAWAVAQQTVMALGNLRLRERTQEQAVANQMVRALSRVGDRAELYSTLREQLGSVAGVPHFTLALYDAERNHVTFPLVVEGAAGALADHTPRPPVGLVRHILNSRQPVRLSGDLAAAAQAEGVDLAGQPIVREGAAPAPAYLGVPLLLGEKIVGALVAQGADAAAFTDRQERLLANAASQTAVALDNLQLYEQARQGLAVSQARTTELEALAETTVALSATLRVADLVTVALDQLQRLLPHARAVVWLRQAHARAKARRVTAEWHAAGVRNIDSERLADRLSLAAGSPLGDVLSSRRPSLIADTGRDTRFGGAARAWLGLPLTHGEDVVGLIELESAAPGGFSPAQLALAGAFAARASLALENARQYEASLERAQSLDDQARRLGLLNQAALALGGSLDLDAQLAAAARLLTENLNADQVQLILWAADGRVHHTTVLPPHAGVAATPPALAAAAPLWERLRTAPAPHTLAELRGDSAAAAPAEQLAWLGPHAATGLLLPLTSAGQTIGAAAIGWNAAEHTFTVAEVEAAQSLARLVAAALAEAAQYETTQQRLSEQATANLISRAVSQALDVPHLVETLRAQLDAWLKPAQLALALYDPAAHTVSFPLVVRGSQAQSLPAAAPDPLLHHLIATQQPLLLTGDVPAQLRELGLPAEAAAGARSYLGVPLRLNDSVLGVLTVADPARAERLTESHQRVLSAVALQLAITLDNARAHAEGLARVAALDERAQRLAWLQHVGAELNATTDPQQIVRLALQRLNEILPSDEAGALLFDESAGPTTSAQALRASQLPGAESDEPPGRVAVAGHPLMERLLPRLRTSPAPVVIDDLTAEQGLTPADSSWIGPATRAASFVPLTYNEQVVGVVGLGRSGLGGRPTPLQSELAAAVGQQAAQALANARAGARLNTELTDTRERLTNEIAATHTRLSDEIVATRDRLNQEIVDTRTRLSTELETTRARLTSELEDTRTRLSDQATAGLISRALSQALDVPHLADLLRTQLEAWLKPGQLTLALYDAARHAVSFPLALVNGQPQTLATQAPSPLLHHLITTQQPLLLSGDAAAEQLRALGLPADALAGAQAYLGVPLRLNDSVLGVLTVADPGRSGALTDSHQRVLNTVALQIAITLENCRQYGEGLARVAALDERAQRLAWLGQLSTELATTLDLPQILSATLRQLADVLMVDQAGALLFDDNAGAPSTAQLLASLPPETAASLLARLPLAGHPLFERVTEADRPLALDDLPAERLIRAEHTGWVGFELRSALFVPLVAGGRALGLLGFGSRADRVWSPADQELAAGAAQQTALALANGRRYAEVQARLAEQTTFSQVLRAVSLAGEVEPLLEVLRARLAGWTGANHFYLALFDETRNELSLPLLVENGRLRSVAPSAPGGLLGHVVQTRHALRLAGDAAPLAHELSLPLHPASNRPLRWANAGDEVVQAHAYLAVPILLGEKVLGALAVEGDAAFTEAHERLLGVIAAQTAVVLDNSRLAGQTRQALAAAQERVAQLEALTTALSNVASVLYSEDVVSVALEQFRRVLPYDHATFWQREATVGSGRELRWRLAGTRGYPEAEARQAFGLDRTYQALFGEIVVGRRPLLVADTGGDSRFGEAGQPLSPRTWLGVPLLAQGEVVGLIVLEKLQPNAYAPAQVAPAMILANQVSAVLSNARQFEENASRALELDERTRRLAFLNRFGAELANQHDLGSLMRLTLKAMTEAMGLEQATGAVFDEQRAALLALEHYPEPAAGQRAGRAALPGNFLLERLQEAPTPITLEDVGAAETHPRLLRQADWIGQEVGAAMFVPLVNNGSLIGLVGLGQSEAGRQFTPAETELGMALANQAAAAVNQARLYERAQQRLAEQASINQMSRALARATDLRALGDQLRQQIEAWVDAESVYLAVYDEDRNEVSFPLAVANDQPVSVAPRAPSGLLRHLLQRRQPLRLNGEITQQLKDQGLFTTGVAGSVGLDDVAAFTSYLAVPLLNGERVAGAVLLGGPRRAEAFDESHERILTAVGAQLAAALDHTRQFEQTRELTAASQSRAAQLSVLTDVSSVIASALRTEQVIALMLDQVQRVLPYERAAFWQRQPAAPGATPRWRAVAQRGHETDLTAQPAVELADPHASALAELYAGRTSLVVPDTAHDPRFAAPGAWLGLPLTHKGEVLGLLALEQSAPNSYSAAQLPLAQAFGSQAAVALANVSLYEDSLQRAVALDARTALLNRVSAALNSTLEPLELFHIALEALTQTLELNQGAVIVFDESRAAGRVHPLLHYPATEVDQAGSLALTANPLLDRLREGLAPLAVEEVSKDALVTPELTAWIAADLRSALILPLVVAGKLIGLLGLGHRYARRHFAPADLELGMTVANQAAIASHNAGLYQRTHRRLVELASISQASRAIGQTIDLKQLYETVRAQVEVGLKADTFYLGLFDEAKNELSFPLAVEHGQAVELSPRQPDRLMRHILTTRQPLLLAGEIGPKLVELGLAAAGAPLPRAKAYLGVPLVAGAKVRGVLVVEDYKRAYAFTDRHEQSLLTIAAPIAAAVDGAALYEESAQKALALNARAALLGRVSAELSETTELDNILRFTAQVISETLLTNTGAAIVLDESPETRTALKIVRYPASYGDDGSPLGPSHPVVQQLQSRLAPLLLDELEAEEEVQAELRAWLGPDIVAALFLPLITGDKLIGLVAVGETNVTRRFTAGELDLAMTLANQAAVAIANARLQQKVQPRLVELATITRLCRAIGEAVTLPQLSETLLAEIGATLKAETIYLALWDAPRNTLTFPLMFDGGQSLAARPQTAAGALRWILEQRQSLLLNGSIARQLSARGITYQPVLAGAAVPQSFLGVPLLIGARVIGVLVVEDQNQVGKFGASHETILTTVAAPIAVAVENAQLHAERTAQAREIEERATQLALVNRLSVALLGVTDPAAIVALTLDTLSATFGVAHAAALVAAPGPDNQWAVVRPTGQVASPDLLPAPAALLALVAKAGHALTVADLAAGDSPAAAELSWLALAPRAVLLLPVRVDEQLIALLALAEDAPRTFEPRAIDLAVTCVNQAAIALENSRLYQQAQSVETAVHAQAAHFSALAEVQQRITAAPDLDAVAATTLAELPRLAPFDSATLWLRDSAEANVLRAVGVYGNQRLGQTLQLNEQPVYTEVISAGAVTVPDTHADARFAAGGSTQSWLGVVLGAGLGVLVLEKTEPNFYTPEHRRAVQAVAGPLAARLAQTRQHAAALAHSGQVEAEARRLDLLQRVTGTVFRTLDLHTVLRGLLTELVGALPVDQAAALLFADPAANSAGPVLVQYPAQNTAAPLPAPGSPVLARLEAGAPVVLNDLAAEGVPPAQLAWLGVTPAAALLLPITAGDAPLGVIALGSLAARPFAPETVALAQSLAGPAGVAVQNARAHAAVARDLAVQVALNRLGPAFAGVRDLDALTPALAAQLAEAFAADTFYLALYHADQREVTFPLFHEGGRARAVNALAPQGVIAHLLQTRQPLNLAGDVAAQLTALELPAAGARARREAGDPSNAAAYLGVPVMVGAEPAGVLSVEGAEAFSAGHLTLLTALAEQVAQVLQRLRAGETTTRTADELAATQERYAQAAQTAQTLEEQLAAQTYTTQTVEQRLAEQRAHLALVRERYAALLAAHPRTARAALDTALNQALRVAGQAVGADYSVLYLEEAGRLVARHTYGSADHLAAVNPADLAAEALGQDAPVIIGDLLTDARWAPPAAAPAPAPDEAGPEAALSGHGNGAHDNGHAAEPANADTERTDLPATVAANGQYHSSLALPVRSAAAGLGVLVFFSTRPGAFAGDALPTAQAAAYQLGYTLEREARLRTWEDEVAARDDDLPVPADTEATLVTMPTRPVAVPVAAEPARPVPAHREPVATQPIHVAPLAPVLADEEPRPIVRPAAAPLWRRLALPVGLVAIVLIVGTALASGPLRGFFAGTPATTAAPATNTVGAVLATETQAAPATEAPASPTVAPTNTTPPTAAASATRTAVPSPTPSAEPSVTPTQPLPPDVLAVATVSLADGIVGRLRDAPNGNIIDGITNGTLVHVISPRQTTSDGITWVQIRVVETGLTGYVGESLLQYETAPPG